MSPSHFPSKQANAVHVVNQCIALSHHKAVTLVCARKSGSVAILRSKLRETYGHDIDRITVKSFYYPFSRGVVFYLATCGVILTLISKNKTQVLSRNLYFSYIFFKIGYQAVYETHNIEIGARSYLQKYCYWNPKQSALSISHALKTLLSKRYEGVSAQIEVLHDGANLVEFDPTANNYDCCLDYWSTQLEVDCAKFKGVVGVFWPFMQGVV